MARNKVVLPEGDTLGIDSFAILRLIELEQQMYRDGDKRSEIIREAIDELSINEIYDDSFISSRHIWGNTAHRV